MTTAFSFAPASKAARKARIALAGPTGSGKTYTALTLAAGLDDRIAVIDTERGSASLYSGAGMFTFDVLEMNTYDPRDLVGALAAAGAAGYGVVIIDSLSHFWEGTGGMLEQVDHAAKRAGGNSFGGWKEARPIERQMIDALLAYPGHVIVTMRTKTEYVVEEDIRGKKVPRKIGLKPVQRDGIEYEFDIVGDLDIENTLVVTKTRCKELSGEVLSKPDELLAKRILAWLDDGAQLPTVPDYVTRAAAAETADELRALYKEVQQRNLGGAAVIDPGTGEALTLAVLIGNYGRALDAVAKAEAAAADASAAEDIPA